MKNYLKLLAISPFVLTLAACGSDGKGKGDDKQPKVDAAPTLEYWEIANYDGIPKLFYSFMNNCTYDIYLNFEVAYYQNNVEIGRSTENSIVCIGALSEAFGIDTYKVEKSADNIKIVNLQYGECEYYEAVPTTSLHDTMTIGLEDKLEFEITKLGDYYETDVYIPVFNFENKLIWCWFKSYFEGEEVKDTLPYDHVQYNSYLIYANCYKLKTK